MREHVIGRERYDICTYLLNLRIQSGHLLKFGRAHEGEVGRIKHYNKPLTSEIPAKLTVITLLFFWHGRIPLFLTYNTIRHIKWHMKDDDPNLRWRCPEIRTEAA